MFISNILKMHIKIIKSLTYVTIIIWIIFSNFLNVYSFNNPYVNEINQSSKVSIDKLVVSISYKKYQLSTEKFEAFIEDITKKLSNLKNKYSNNNEIIGIINYLNYELSIINTDEKISEEELEKFLCSNWNCKSNSIINSNSNTWTIYTSTNITSSNFWSCAKSSAKFYKSWESCIWANFECKNWKYYWWAQSFSTDPIYPEYWSKLYDKYNLCMNDNDLIISNDDSSNIIITQDSKECKFNMKPYFDLWLKTTFYYSDKSYEPDSKGNMILPWNMNSDFYAYKWDATNPQVYFRCNDWKLSIYNSNYSLIEPLKWVLSINETSLNNENNAPTINDTKVICAWNWWPTSIEISWNWNFNAFEIKTNAQNKLINLVNNSTTNKYIAQLSNDVEKVNIYPYNSSEIITSIDVKKCTSNNYAAKPEIISAVYNKETKTLVIKTKNALKNDYIDIFDWKSNWSLFWEKDTNWTYTATLSDPYYNSLNSYILSWKSYVWIYWSFEPNYWRNSVRNTTYPINISTESDFTYSRSYDSKWQWIEWKTSSNVSNLAWKSVWPNWTRSSISWLLNLSREFASYDDLEKNGWLKWNYDMTWTITLKDWSTKVFKEYFTIP